MQKFKTNKVQLMLKRVYKVQPMLKKKKKKHKWRRVVRLQVRTKKIHRSLIPLRVWSKKEVGVTTMCPRS